jgi:hypothetical protein
MLAYFENSQCILFWLHQDILSNQFGLYNEKVLQAGLVFLVTFQKN